MTTDRAAAIAESAANTILNERFSAYTAMAAIRAGGPEPTDDAMALLRAMSNVVGIIEVGLLVAKDDPGDLTWYHTQIQGGLGHLVNLNTELEHMAASGDVVLSPAGPVVAGLAVRGRALLAAGRNATSAMSALCRQRELAKVVDELNRNSPAEDETAPGGCEG